MQIKIFFYIFLIGLIRCCQAELCDLSEVDVEYHWISNSEEIINVSLPSGTKINGVVYEYRALSDSWVLRLNPHNKIKIHKDYGMDKNISDSDFNCLIKGIIQHIKTDKNRLEAIHLPLGIVEKIWLDIEEKLRNGLVPNNYIAKGKDIKLKKIVISILEKNSTITKLCTGIEDFPFFCRKKRLLDMNPMTFKHQYVGKKWSVIKQAPNLGIPKDLLWFSIRLIPSNQTQQGNTH